MSNPSVAKWQRNNQPLFDNITYLLLTRTITLFETRQSISEQYIPISWIEKLNQKVKILNPADEKAVPGVDNVGLILTKGTF